jgi:hypothetical protein
LAKLKTPIRKVGARTYEALCDAAAETLKAYFPHERAAYFKNAGYA